jgi:transcriptional regulator with XRE-family HTH domain
MYSEMNGSFSDWLNKQLIDRELSQAALARLSGLSRGTISNLINNVRNPGPDVLEAISIGLKLPKESVYRAAGLLDARPSGNGRFEELKYLYAQLPDRDQAEIIDFIRLKLERHEQLIAELKKKYNPFPPVDSDQAWEVMKDYLRLLGVKVTER